MIFDNEFRNYIIKKFNEDDVIYSSDEKTENLLIYYIDFILRSFINRTKFKIHYSLELADKINKNSLTLNEINIIKLIETKLNNLESIKDFLSKKVYKYNYPKDINYDEQYVKGDNLFGNWMISHFHLGDSKNLLFVKLGKTLNDVYFLDVL